MNLRYPDSLKFLSRTINDALFNDYIVEWDMTYAERCTLIMLLSKIKPEYAIEIGTSRGGSLSAISQFSKNVYALDHNPMVRERLAGKFSNVELIIGKFQQTFEPLLEQIQTAGNNLDFVLLDGDHSRNGVKQQIEMLLNFRPTQPLYVVIHDSFNPDCRQGILDANWSASPYVHYVELDFVPGTFHSRSDIHKEMWGGFALAQLLPVERKDMLRIEAYHELQFQTVLPYSIHQRQRQFRVRFLLAVGRRLQVVKSIFK